MNSLPVWNRLLTALWIGGLGAMVAPAAEQFPDGRIAFEAPASVNAASWGFKPTRWGRYEVEATVSAVGSGAELQVEIAGQTLTAGLPADAGTGPRAVTIGRFYLATSEPFTLRAGPRPGAAAVFTLGGVTLKPAPEGDAVVQQASGEILLRSREATTHSVMMRYEPATNKNCLGYWVDPADRADWDFTVTSPGAFEVQVWQGCGRGNGGSDVDVLVNAEKRSFVVEETGHFQNFVPRFIGRVTLASGVNHLVLQPRNKRAAAVMDLRQIRLVPAAGEVLPTEAARAVLAARRIVVLGDSITYGGEWVEFAEAWIRARFPGADPEFLNLGLPSETVSGLSEDGHAGGSFPRPDLNERLARVLGKSKPDLILACYGMNDGIYFPLAEERFAKFRDGTRRLHESAEHEGVRVIHLTPPVFDSVPLAGRTLPAGLTAYPQPFEGYDGVLQAYSEWLVGQRTNGWEVVDVHGPMRRFIDTARQSDPAFKLAGDGIHANTQGHWLIARELLRSLGAPAAVVDSSTADPVFAAQPRGAELLRLVQQRQRVLKDSWLTHTGHKRPGMAAGKPLEEAEAEAAKVRSRMTP